jgi:hypothetical protein
VKDSIWRQFIRKTQTVASKFVIEDHIKGAYLRTSFLFAVSVLVTWIPSSINRISGLVNPTSTPYSYNVATAAVLPLQGVWNCIIYFTTSATLLRECWVEWQERRRRAREAKIADSTTLVHRVAPSSSQSHRPQTLAGSWLKNQSSSESLDFLDALALGSDNERQRANQRY